MSAQSIMCFKSLTVSMDMAGMGRDRIVPGALMGSEERHCP